METVEQPKQYSKVRSFIKYFRYFILPKFICRVIGHRFVPVDMTMTWRKRYGQTYCCLRCYAESASDKKLIEVILD